MPRLDDKTIFARIEAAMKPQTVMTATPGAPSVNTKLGQPPDALQQIIEKAKAKNQG